MKGTPSADIQINAQRRPSTKLKLPIAAAEKAGQSSQRKTGATAGPLGGLKLPNNFTSKSGTSLESNRSGSNRSGSEDTPTQLRQQPQASQRKSAPKLKLPGNESTAQTSNRKGKAEVEGGKLSHRQQISDRRGKAKGKASSSRGDGSVRKMAASAGTKRRARSSAAGGGVDHDRDDLDEYDGGGQLEPVSEVGRSANPYDHAMLLSDVDVALPAPVPAYMHDQLQAAIRAGDNDLVEELLDCLRVSTSHAASWGAYPVV